jgi:hypothetical protein
VFSWRRWASGQTERPPNAAGSRRHPAQQPNRTSVKPFGKNSQRTLEQNPTVFGRTGLYSATDRCHSTNYGNFFASS